MASSQPQCYNLVPASSLTVRLSPAAAFETAKRPNFASHHTDSRLSRMD